MGMRFGVDAIPSSARMASPLLISTNATSASRCIVRSRSFPGLTAASQSASAYLERIAASMVRTRSSLGSFVAAWMRVPAARRQVVAVPKASSRRRSAPSSAGGFGNAGAPSSRRRTASNDAASHPVRAMSLLVLPARMPSMASRSVIVACANFASRSTKSSTVRVIFASSGYVAGGAWASTVSVASHPPPATVRPSSVARCVSSSALNDRSEASAVALRNRRYVVRRSSTRLAATSEFGGGVCQPAPVVSHDAEKVLDKPRAVISIRASCPAVSGIGCVLLQTLPAPIPPSTA